MGKLLKVQSIKGKKIIIVLIFCVGLGMLDGVLKLILNVKISVVGLYCDEILLQLVVYFDKVVKNIDKCMVLIVDFMLVIGGMFIVIIDLLKVKGCKKIMGLFFVVVLEGIDVVVVVYFDVDIYIVVIDDCLNEKGYILFGLGDVGDKIFGIC